MDRCKTIQVKPWSDDQGDYVEINADDFDHTVHTLIDADPLGHDSDGKRGGSKPRAKRGAA